MSYKKGNKFGKKFQKRHKPLGRALKGHITTEETKKKISIAHKGMKPSKEAKKKMSQSHKGKKLSKQDKYNKSIAQIKRWDKIGRKKYKRYIHLTQSKKYKKWRMEVFSRDNWTCQICKEIGGRLVAHHIKSWAYCPKLRFDIDNGVTLCEDCHKLTDNYCGRKRGIQKAG